LADPYVLFLHCLFKDDLLPMVIELGYHELPSFLKIPYVWFIDVLFKGGDVPLLSLERDSLGSETRPLLM
jgi:hypothetical protein